MHRGGGTINRRSRGDLLNSIRNAPSRVQEIYRSDFALIKRVAVRSGGCYFIVVESDITTSEDEMALSQLTCTLGGAWRDRILETDHFEYKHPEFLWSSSFSIHVVHPECPSDGSRRRPID